MTHSPVLSRAGERLTASGRSSLGIRPRGIFTPHLSTWHSPDSTNNQPHFHHHISFAHQKRSRSVRTEQAATLTRSSVISTPDPHTPGTHPHRLPLIQPQTSTQPLRRCRYIFTGAYHHRPASNSERPNSSHQRHTAKLERSSTSCRSSSGTHKATPTHPLSRPLHL